MDPRRLLPVLTAVACACVVATLVVTVARPAESPPGGPTTPAAAREGPASRSLGPAPHPPQVLADWDARRSAAWAAGDAAALAGLYADGSRTGAADVRLLRRYRDRGLTVEGLTTQLLSVRVARHSPRRMVLVVTDRVVAGRVVGARAPVVLPADRASVRRVVLVRPGSAWLVGEARDQASAAASTSRTSSSSKS